MYNILISDHFSLLDSRPLVVDDYNGREAQLYKDFESKYRDYLPTYHTF